MKPIKLTLQAFGSYGERTIIDFTRPSQSLFLVTGDTGAGKTTIFDALVYALYGENSSNTNKKTGNDLQSQFVGRDIEPFVELTFSEAKGGNDEIYTVHRTPAHFRKRQRGTGGDIAVNESIALTLPDGTDFCGKNNEINAKLQEILGLTKEQFMQVGMIAQGEFMELLRTDSATKKEIFRKLFNTDIFQRLIDALKERNKDAQGKMEKLLLRCKLKAEDIRLPEGTPADSTIAQLKAAISNADKPNIATIERLMEELLPLCENLGQQEKDLTAEYEVLAAQQEKSISAYTAGKILANAYDELDKITAQEKELLAQQPQQEKEAQLSQAILSAWQIKAAYDIYAGTDNLLQKTSEQKERESTRLPQLKAAEEQSQARNQAAQEAQKEELARLATLQTKVAAAQDNFAAIAAAEKACAAAQTKATKAQAENSSAQKKAADFKEEVQQWNQRFQELSPAEGKMQEWVGKQEKINTWQKQRQDLVDLKQKLATAQNTATQAQTAFKQAEASYQQEQAAYEHAHRIFLNAQAGLLAANLQPDTPCPVCGSTTHPHPYILAAEEQPLERQELEALQKKVQQLNRQQNDASQEAGKALARYNNLNEQYQSAKESFITSLQEANIAAETDMSDIAEELNKWQAIIQNKLQEYTLAVQEAKTLKEKLATSAEKLDQLEKAAQNTDKEHRQLETEWQNLNSQLETLKGQQAYASPAAAEAELQAGKRKLQQSQAAAKQAETEMAADQKARQEAETIIKDCDSKLPQQKLDKEAAFSEYQKICTAKGLTEEQWTALTTQYTAQDGETKRIHYQEYKETCQGIQGQKAAQSKNINQQERPDLAALAAAQSAINTQCQELDERRKQVQQMRQRNEEAATTLRGLIGSRNSKLADTARLESLYNRLSGKMKGSRMDIETFVQRHYLQQILLAANYRFAEMSAGQFELRLMPVEDAGQGKNRGLDLRVYSTVTGQERDIKTLSGGESFMAALSLALGLSDQIQANTAAINLDIMFIDEGFGSLDDHSRGQAIRVLKRLSSGNKLIGIISHVTELKQEIDNQLLVRKDDKGSHVQWQIN
ncbi:exonuclease SbcC [Selenomonas ruminantium]|uniref:Nuclease SbcCD subunit C n=1 Tax=Selenomonas ruminantium TaxID=971 RepID=A0A1M6S0M3_SELRU|nr:SMC family ATPase [Selenomonas ruminantium]SHK38286.1 exonuclease SbcC [Selenomonas ruminantium]